LEQTSADGGLATAAAAAAAAQTMQSALEAVLAAPLAAPSMCVGMFTDVEGDWTYFEMNVNKSKVLSWGDEAKSSLTLAEGAKFVFGGDVRSICLRRRRASEQHSPPVQQSTSRCLLRCYIVLRIVARTVGLLQVGYLLAVRGQWGHRSWMLFQPSLAAGTMETIVGCCFNRALPLEPLKPLLDVVPNANLSALFFRRLTKATGITELLVF
jgi:hypothetical protein